MKLNKINFTKNFLKIVSLMIKEKKMKKYLFLILCSILVSACSGKNYNVKKYKNEIPKWYVEDKKLEKSFR